MGRYRRIQVCIWNDDKFPALSDDAKLVFFLLLTHPHMTALGAMRATLEGLGAELRWGPGRFRKAFAEVFGKGMVRYDPSACCLVLPKFIKHNPPESPNVVRAWSKATALIPDCRLKAELLQQVKAFLEGFGEGFGEAFAKAFGEALRQPSPNPDPEQEQEPEKDSEVAPRFADEPAPPAAPALYAFPCTRGELFSVTQAHLDEWAQNFPDVDLHNELLQARSWLSCNPKKTIAGMPRFFHRWLSKAQNRARGQRHADESSGVDLLDAWARGRS